MSVVLVASGTGNGGAALTIGVELAVYNPSPGVSGMYQLVVDLNLLADGDTLEIRAKQMVLTGGTTRVVYMQAYANARPADDQIVASVPVTNDLTDNGAVQFSLKQTTGTGRAFPWKIVRIG